MENYYNFKQKNNSVAQTNVAQKKDYIIRARVDEKLYNKIKASGIKEGYLIREVLTQYFQQIEIEDLW